MIKAYIILLTPDDRFASGFAEETIEIDTEKDYGITAIGYSFTPLGNNKQIFVHPAQYKKIIIDFKEEV